jgi:hypothetical protein
MRNTAIVMKDRTSSDPCKASAYCCARECQLKMVGGDVGIDTIWLIQARSSRRPGGGPRRWPLQSSPSPRPAQCPRSARDPRTKRVAARRERACSPRSRDRAPRRSGPTSPVGKAASRSAEAAVWEVARHLPAGHRGIQLVFGTKKMRANCGPLAEETFSIKKYQDK